MNFVTGRIPQILALILGLGFTTHCARHDEEGKSYLLPWGPVNGVYSLREVKIETMNSPYEVSGPDAEVYAGNYLSLRGFVGDKAKPNLTLSKNVFIPKDVESSVSLVAYAHTERIRKLDRELGIEHNLRWPRQIGIQIHAEDDQGVTEFNNAIYLGDQDAIAFFPMNQKSLPLSVNGGVIAHEHFHAHFQAFGLKVEFPALSQPEMVFSKSVVIRGWNEGLADFYSYVYTGESDFLTVSLSHQANRKLTRDVLPLRSRDSLFESFVDSRRTEGDVLACISYPLGTQIAIFLYHIVQLETAGDEKRNAKKWMSNIIYALQGKERILSSHTESLDPKLLIHWIFESAEVNKQQADLLKFFTSDAPYNLVRRAYPCGF